MKWFSCYMSTHVAAPLLDKLGRYWLRILPVCYNAAYESDFQKILALPVRLLDGRLQ